MSIEIERKYLVKKELLPEPVKSIRILQAYLQIEPERTVRIRVLEEKAFITIKGPLKGISRPEFEYEIPVVDAREIMKMAKGIPVEKVRHEIYYKGKRWEVDIFKGENEGLVIAEIELESDSENFDLPEWVTEEVSSDMRYHNSQLSRNPFSRWE